ncbi:MAG: hypothetical protein E7633_02720 [Ruminococcaceae bacterium]|nr:hypothetical protein [Oscillospiraceae bacterium]
MKKLISVTLTVLIVFSALALNVFAENDSTSVYVTISDKDGKLVLIQEKITVNDIDNDGALTINDALYCAHEAKYEGGAEAGYKSEESQWGISLMKLWGAENGGSYGYMLNNASATGLTNTVKNGDYLNAYVYTDLETWSDTFCYFDAQTKKINKGESITLTLSYIGYDANWNSVVLPVEDATVTVNGEETTYKTDASGKVTLVMEKTGDFVISAKSSSQTLVPPAVKVNVSEKSTGNPETGDLTAIYALIPAALIFGMAFIPAKRNKI